MKYIFVSALFLLSFCVQHTVCADEIVSQSQELEISGDLPKFEDYKVVKEHSNFAKSVDIKSYKGAHFYKTSLLEGFLEKPNYAGHYVIMSHGCGSWCQRNWVMDKKTGKIIFDVYSENGFDFQVDSRLLIINPPESQILQDSTIKSDEIPYDFKTTYYLVEKGKMKLLLEKYPFVPKNPKPSQGNQTKN